MSLPTGLVSTETPSPTLRLGVTVVGLKPCKPSAVHSRPLASFSSIRTGPVLAFACGIASSRGRLACPPPPPGRPHDRRHAAGWRARAPCRSFPTLDLRGRIRLQEDTRLRPARRKYCSHLERFWADQPLRFSRPASRPGGRPMPCQPGRSLPPWPAPSSPQSTTGRELARPYRRPATAGSRR